MVCVEQFGFLVSVLVSGPNTGRSSLRNQLDVVINFDSFPFIASHCANYIIKWDILLFLQYNIGYFIISYIFCEVFWLEFGAMEIFSCSCRLWRALITL